jgi:hypothetical protein
MFLEGHHAKRKHFGVPGKQREVLESSSLIEVLGKDLVMLLRVAQGVPRGVNVKNLVRDQYSFELRSNEITIDQWYIVVARIRKIR